MRAFSVATKLSLVIALLVTVSLGTMSAFAVWASRQSLREQVHSANLTAATLAARAVEQYILDASAIMHEAAGRPKLSREIWNKNWPEAAKVLENFLQNFPQFDYVFVQDPAGVIRVRVPHAETVGQDFSFRDFFQEATRTRRLYVSGVYVSKAAQRPVVSIAMPVLDDAGSIRGVLVGALSLKMLGQFVSTMGLEQGSVVYLIDRNGLLIAHSGRGEVGPRADMKGRPPVQAALAGTRGTTEFREPGGDESFLAAHVPIARLGWGVVAEQPVTVAYGAASRLGRRLLWLTLGFTAVSVVLGWGLARTLSGPVVRFVRATERLGAGDFSVRVVPESRDEVGALAVSFNTMAEQLQRSYHDLEEKTREVTTLNEDLERRVAQRTQQLEMANRGLEAFSYTVSHDLKAPLRGMEGFARALQEDYADRLDETGNRYLTMIQGGAHRMGQLIDDLLRYSRLERRQMRRERTQLRSMIEGLCEELAEEIRARGLTVQLDLAVDAVEAEREGLREALANLIGNAVKFSRHGEGTITIGSQRDGDDVLLWVTDTGIGFDMKYHDRIFGIFERLHRQEDYPGTGVGLAIVRKVAERHGGRAWARSEPEKGTTFYLALPVSAGGSG